MDIALGIYRAGIFTGLIVGFYKWKTYVQVKPLNYYESLDSLPEGFEAFFCGFFWFIACVLIAIGVNWVIEGFNRGKRAEK